MKVLRQEILVQQEHHIERCMELELLDQHKLKGSKKQCNYLLPILDLMKNLKETCLFLFSMDRDKLLETCRSDNL